LGREWTSSAQWKFREYNELPHLLKRRLRRAYLASTLYVSCFPLAWGSVIGQFASFLCGSVMVCLLVLGVLHNDILVNGDFFGLNGLWLLGILGGVVAVSRGLIPDDNAVQEPEEVRNNV
jgi:autophagy-related protein 9